jgi:hypothetical protein
MDVDSEESLAYLGHITQYSPTRGVGAVRSRVGKRVDFDIRFCELAGVGRGDRIRDHLEEGMAVDFDVGWTSRGLRVTWMRARAAEDSERQAGAEGEVAPEETADQNREGRDVE